MAFKYCFIIYLLLAKSQYASVPDTHRIKFNRDVIFAHRLKTYKLIKLSIKYFLENVLLFNIPD